MRSYKYSVLAGAVLAVGLLVSPLSSSAAEIGESVATSSLSADNSLCQLSISGAEISPDFYYSTVKYSASVPYEVTEVEVTAKTSNAGASIKSISGYNNLSVGENTIKIVVTAENGNEATYTVVVTRLAEDNASDNVESTDDMPASDDVGSSDGAENSDDASAAIDADNSDDAESSDDAEISDDEVTAGELEDSAEVSGALSSAQITSSSEYTQLLANYNAAVNSQKQLEKKLRLITAVFLFVIGILLIIFVSVLWTKRSSEFDEKEVFDDEEQPIKKERPLETISVARPTKERKTEEAKNSNNDSVVNTKQKSVAKPEAKPEVKPEVKPEAKPVAKIEEASAVKKESTPARSSKKIKRRDSILAYLGLDDDLPLDYGEVLDEDESENEPAAADDPKDSRVSKAGLAPENKNNSGRNEKTDSAEDIEFIDL